MSDITKNNPIDKRNSAAELPDGKPGPFLARVIQVVDSEYMGKIRVQILHFGSSGNLSEGELAWATYLPGWFGTTSQDFLRYNNSGKAAFDDTQKSWGMWVPTPEIGSQVVVIFLEGMANQGYWFGCVPEKYKNFMVPGIAATELNKDYTAKSRVPVAEFNAKLNDQAGDMATNTIKPVHPFIFDSLKNQGLINDDTRGITSSSARRESPSRVWGVSTPGPVDKKGPTGDVGTTELFVKAAYSRLGGSQFVMDDGDDKFIRNTPASDGPPVYNVVKPGTPPQGDVTVPHNELIRLRTRTGHQILLHNSEDLIYIGNAKGTAWIELTSNGKIDIYSKDSISIHTANDLNITADRDINMEAGRNFNVKSKGKSHIESGGNLELVVGANGFITTKGNLNVGTTGNNVFSASGNTSLRSGGVHAETANKIYMNSDVGAGVAATASPLSTTPLPDRDNSTRVSITRRVPTREPYEHHENLDPQQFTPAKTDRDSTGNFQTPKYFDNYTTSVDTFKQGKK